MQRIPTCQLTVCLVLSVALSLAAQAQPARDPAAALREIQQWMLSEIRAAQARNIPVSDVAMVRDPRTVAKARAAVKGVDAEKVEPAQGAAWARLFDLAEMPKEQVAASNRFMQSDPPPDQKFLAQLVLLQGCDELKDGAGIQRVIGEIQPPTPKMAAMLAMFTAVRYAGTVAEKLGAPAALELLAKVEALVPFDDLKTDIEQKAAQHTIASLVTRRASLLEQVGKPDEAKAVREAGRKRLTEGTRPRAVIEGEEQRARLPGSTAPELQYDRVHGSFKSLEALRGKVVLLNFTAHWCVPCRDAYPMLKQLYRQSHNKGLEVVGVTSYYGSYKTESSLSPETEFARMGAYITSHGLPWPLVFGSEANMAAYGVITVPQHVVIDAQGQVAAVEVGDSDEMWQRLRSTVERLLKRPTATP